MANTSSYPMQDAQHPRISIQSSVDSYSCVDLTDALEEATPDHVAGGSFSDIYKYKHRAAPSNAPIYFAVKKFRYVLSGYKLTEGQIERRIKKEILNWRRLGHPNIMPMEGVVYRENCRYPCLVSRWMPNGTASNYCADTTNEVEFLKFISGISDGLSYMHRKDTTHGDIRGDNILVSETGQALITDFGLAKIILPEQPISSTIGYGTLRYLAPELIFDGLSRKPTFKGDVWMFGMTALELWSGAMPFSLKSEPEVVLALYNNELPDLSNASPMREAFKPFKERVHSVCSLCWTVDPRYRPPMHILATLIRTLISWDPDSLNNSPDAEEPDPADDSGIDLSPNMSGMSISAFPLLISETPNFSGGGLEGCASGSRRDSNPMALTTTARPLESNSALPFTAPGPQTESSEWAKFPIPPSFVEIASEGTSKNARTILNEYIAKSRRHMNYTYEKSESGHWIAKCIADGQEIGRGQSSQKRAAEEDAARNIIQTLSVTTPNFPSQGFQLLPAMRRHLEVNKLPDRIRFEEPRQDGNHPALSQICICDVIKDGVKVCEGQATFSDEAREMAARKLSILWRESATPMP